MKTKALLPVGEKSNYQMVERGDIIELITGEKVTFVEMKRTKWFGQFNGKGIVVPIYRNRITMVPYAKAIIGKDKSVITVGAKLSTMKLGQLFSLEGHKETFMFIKTETKRGGKPIIKGRDLATGKTYNIDAAFKLIKIDINKLKKELINA